MFKIIIKALVENETISKELESEHGLSIYLETSKHKLLFDTGASNLFSLNAVKMGVDLKEVNLAVLSHGHYDHGGGLATFLEINQKAPIYLNQKAFGDYYSKAPSGDKKYIGIDKALSQNKRMIFVEKQLSFEDEFELFSEVKGEKLFPSGNQSLLMKIGDNFELDDFSHEQNLLIKEEEKRVLLTGCSHRGIINILEEFYKLYNCWPTHVLGGFHLYNPISKKDEDEALVREIASFLLDTKAQYYTCHCTGKGSYNILKEEMKDKLEYLATGTILDI